MLGALQEELRKDAGIARVGLVLVGDPGSVHYCVLTNADERGIATQPIDGGSPTFYTWSGLASIKLGL